MEKEKVNCRYCKETTEIVESTLCKCGVRLLTTKETKETILVIEKQIVSLNAQHLRLSADLAHREQFKLIHTHNGPTTLKENFWSGVVGRPEKFREKTETKDPTLRAIEAIKKAGIEL